MPPPGPAAPARLSLRPTAGKRPPRPFKNKLCSPLDGLPSENKHSSSARLPGTLAGAHAHASGAPLQPRLPRPATRPPPPPALACRRRGGHQIPLPTLRRGDPHSAPVRSAAAGAPEENAAEQANGVSGAGTSPAGGRGGGEGGVTNRLSVAPPPPKFPGDQSGNTPPPPPQLPSAEPYSEVGGGGSEPQVSGCGPAPPARPRRGAAGPPAGPRGRRRPARSSRAPPRGPPSGANKTR